MHKLLLGVADTNHLQKLFFMEHDENNGLPQDYLYLIKVYVLVSFGLGPENQVPDLVLGERERLRS